MTRADWERLSAREGKLIEIELERTPTMFRTHLSLLMQNSREKRRQ